MSFCISFLPVISSSLLFSIFQIFFVLFSLFAWNSYILSLIHSPTALMYTLGPALSLPLKWVALSFLCACLFHLEPFFFIRCKTYAPSDHPFSWEEGGLLDIRFSLHNYFSEILERHYLFPELLGLGKFIEHYFSLTFVLVMDFLLSQWTETYVLKSCTLPSTPSLESLTQRSI